MAESPALAAAAAGSRGWRCTTWQPEHWLRLVDFDGPATAPTCARSRSRAATCAAAARRPLPAVACRAVLNHARISAHEIAVQILLAGVAVVLPVFQRRVPHLDQRILVTRVV